MIVKLVGSTDDTLDGNIAHVLDDDARWDRSYLRKKYEYRTGNWAQFVIFIRLLRKLDIIQVRYG